MSGDWLRVMMVRGFSTCTSVLKGGRSSSDSQPSSKTWRVRGSKRPLGLMPAARPRLRSGRTRTPLCSIIAFAISARPAPKAAMSARTICSIFALSQGISAGLRIALLMKLFLFALREQIKNFLLISCRGDRLAYLLEGSRLMSGNEPEKPRGRPPFALEGIDHILLMVDGMEVACTFYQEVIGCTFEESLPEF